MRTLRWMRRLASVTLVLGLLVLNVLTLTSSVVAGLLSSALDAVGVETVAAREARKAEARRARTATRLRTVERRAAALSARLGTATAALTQLEADTARLKHRVAGRLRGVSHALGARMLRNAGSKVVNSVPVLGAVFAAGLVAVEVAEACATMQDMAAIGALLGDETTDQSGVCALAAHPERDTLTCSPSQTGTEAMASACLIRVEEANP